MIIFVVVFLFAVVVQQYQYCQAQHNRHDSKLFYIYDSAEWAKVANLSIAKRELNERMDSAFNGGAGAIIDENGGAFHTDQYQLFSMIFYRALKDFRRTLDPSKATSFIIPYDFASDALYHKQKCSGDQCHDLRKCPKASNVEALLRESEWFRRHNGKDHLLLVGTNYAMHHYNFKPKCKSLLLTCGNCTKFAIDDYSFMYSGNAGIDAQGDYWHSAPFPADFHWTRKVQRPFPWENRDRPVLMSYIGSDKSFYGPARRLRGSIIHYCNLHRDHCTLQSYGAKGTRQSSNVEGHKPLKLSQRSVFCFQPIGDLMTRKGLFDSLLQGCIPVVFDPLTASVMYTWHWEEAFWREISVELPFHPVAYRYMDPVLFLLNLTQSDTTGRVSRMQELIRSRVFELQYSLDAVEEIYQFNSSLRYVTLMQHNRSSNHSADRTVEHTLQYKEVTYESLMSASSDAGVKSNVTIESNSDHTVVKSTHTVDTWPVYADGTRMRDAYDICIDLMLGWHSGEQVRFRNATVPECWDGWLDTVANKCIPGEEPKVKSVK